MSSDCYRIEVLHFLNPHLVWVEVVKHSNANEGGLIFEQIGLYGVLPLEPVLDVEEENLQTRLSDEWLTAASATIKDALSESQEVWFSTTYIDRRASIFDDNIHKYGEILLKKANGKYYPLSKKLTKSGFAMYDVCLFHQKLGNGILKTKLNSQEAQEVLKNIEHFYDKKKIPNMTLQKSIKSNTVVTRTSQKFAMELTEMNLEKHNKKLMSQLLHNKMKDFEMCKGIEEESVGRACKAKHQKENIAKGGRDRGGLSEPDSKSMMLKRKFELLASKKSIKKKNNTDINSDKTINILEENENYDLSQNDGNNKLPSNIMHNESYDENSHFLEDEANEDSNVNMEAMKKESDYDDSSSDLAMQSFKSNILKKKLMLHQGKFAKILNSSFTSDTTNKDSSSSVEDINQIDKMSQVISDSDDEDIDEVIKIINKEYPAVTVSTMEEETRTSKCPIDMENYKSEKKTSVNPFKHTNMNMSSFTDKVVAPVLMVHTKTNKRIEPVLKISDVHFNTHIQVVLRNMSIVRPMMLQTISWFCILRGYSTFIVSPPGSGKTLGYLPAVCRLVSDSCPEDNAGVGPKCIIVCATANSLAEVERMAKMFLGVNERVLTCFTGVNEADISTSLLNGCDLLISTPSFLVRLLQNVDLGFDVRRLATVVMDDCERLSHSYRNEVKYILFRIKDSIKYRTNKELKVQYVLASRTWSDFMEPLAKKASHSVLCFGAFQECVLYCKANVSLKFVQKDDKINSLYEFMDNIDITKKIVIVCDTDAEVNEVWKALAKSNNPIFACDGSLTIQELYNLSVVWNDYENPLLGPILLCCDDTLVHLNITDAHYLLSYSLPRLYSEFCKRFSVLIDNYPSIFNGGGGDVKINVLIEDTNVRQLPKIISFIERCTDNIPDNLYTIGDSVLVEKDCVRASKLVPLCDTLLSLGYCADLWNCLSRHSIFKDYDESKAWMPKNGVITFKILHYHNAALYSVRLLSNIVDGIEHNYPQTYSTLSIKMGLFYSKESNKKPHGIPKVGDVCAVSLKENFFVRCQIIKVMSYYPKGNPNTVLIKLIDEETLEITRDIYLYCLPEELRDIDTYVIQVRLANIQPKDKDVTFSNLARDELKKITDSHEELFVRGEAVMAVGNCVFVETLEVCQDLSLLNKIVVKYDLRHNLLEKHATTNVDHVSNIYKLCEGQIAAKVLLQRNPSTLSTEAQTLPPSAWAELDSNNLSMVLFASAINPRKVFVRLAKSQPRLHDLIIDIQRHVTANPQPLTDMDVSDIVLAMFPDDRLYERARIDSILGGNIVRCFFVDQGDWRNVSHKHILPMTEEFLHRMPFQAIECSLVGVSPVGDDWTDFSVNWIYDKCFDEKAAVMKNILVKYFYKLTAEFTGGDKYGVVMIDTNGEVDVVINQSLIDVNLARENANETKFLNEFQTYFDPDCTSGSNEYCINGNVHEIGQSCECPNVQVEGTPCSPLPLQTDSQNVIVTVPLVTDCEDPEILERWHINMSNDFFSMFLPTTNPAPHPSDLASTITDELSNFIETAEIRCEVLADDVPEEIDSDGYASPASTVHMNDSVQEIISIPQVDQMRKPRLIWRQNQNSVVIKINLIGLQVYNLTIEGRSIAFAANNNGVEYAFDFELYGAVDVKNSSHCNKGQYILVKLSKILNKNWLTLTKDGAIRKWIVYDVDAIDASSDEEAQDDDNKNMMLNAIKNIVDQDDTESEDEEFEDDLNNGQHRQNILFHEC